MALSGALAKQGTPPTSLDTKADVTFQPGEGITGVHITVVGDVEGMSDEDFKAAAEGAKQNCPVSKALTAARPSRWTPRSPDPGRQRARA